MVRIHDVRLDYVITTNKQLKWCTIIGIKKQTHNWPQLLHYCYLT